MEDSLVTSEQLQPTVSPSSLLNSTPHSWTWPEHPRLFLHICSGAGYPLSKAMLACGCACFPVDTLDNSFYEPLSRVCASGIISYGAGAPHCGEYSRLKLREGGPPALRTPECLQGLPNLSPAQLLKVQSSFELMVRIDICLELVYSAGGHVHLEQPTNSMAWLEKDVARFIKFCTSFSEFCCLRIRSSLAEELAFSMFLYSMSSLGTVRNHPKNSHEVIAGQMDDGTFRGHKTAEYPESMCSAIA